MNLQRKISLAGLATAAENGAASLAGRYRAIRAATERLAAPLSAEDRNLQSMPDASPVKWHLAHTTWFFETFVLAKTPDYRAFDPAYSFLFNSYYDAIGPRHVRPQRGLLSRPSYQEIEDYRRHVDLAMLELLRRGVEPIANTVELGIAHEEQHQELILTDILHAFGQNPLRPAYAEFRDSPEGPRTPASYSSFDGGPVDIGHVGGSFAFDNETPRHRVLLEPFSLANQLVTNAEWLEFMAAGGYRDPKFWLSDGWQCAVAEGWQAPLYWEESGGKWQAMTLAGMQPLDPEAPVAHVGFYEAEAFARWRGKRLPTEAEWEHAASAFDPREGNFREAGYLRPLAPQGPNARQTFGDVWEWTASAYAPYPGYRALDGAIGEYNGKFMVNQMALRGGSCVTPQGHVRASYRNFFYPRQRWQFSGLRLAEDAPRKRNASGPSASQFLRDVWEGLSLPQKRISSKYFYDANGAELFQEICCLPEYYLTRTECGLLTDLASELDGMLAPNAALVEFGSGSSLKTRILLNRIPRIRDYVPIDIDGESLRRTAAMLADEYPDLRIHPLTADFMQPVALPEDLRARPLLGFFPGSTIGNLTDGEADSFLARARGTLGETGKLLIGLDLIKAPETLVAAYNDKAGITAAFNLNLLVRMNRELSAAFDVRAFSHRALWNDAKRRIEAHLVSKFGQTASVSGRSFAFRAGETIHTENSRKYTVKNFAARAARSSWSLERSWISGSPEFAVLLLG